MERADGRAAGPEGGPRHRRPDHHLREGAGGRLLHAFHEPWHQHFIQVSNCYMHLPIFCISACLYSSCDLPKYYVFKGSPRRSPRTCSPSCRRCHWTSGSTRPRPTSGCPSYSSSWPGSAPTSGTTPTPATTRPRCSSTSSLSATRCGSPSAASCSRAATSPPSKKLGRGNILLCL